MWCFMVAIDTGNMEVLYMTLWERGIKEDSPLLDGKM